MPTRTGIRLRPAGPDDRPLLYDVYASTRTEEMAVVGWDAAQVEAFLTQQFEVQDTYYREHYPHASFDVVLADGTPAGRLSVARGPEEIRVVDIALLPAFRNRGIGTTLLRELIDEGASSGRPVTVHVERFNPAMRLYERLGFRPVENRGVHVLLRCTPDA